MLTDTLNGELGGVGPEDILSESQLEELQYALTEQVMILIIIVIQHKKIIWLKIVGYSYNSM